ncbi:MAG: Pyridoxamine 5-phosphate oxidase [Acidimicrobiaceae bacterium]|nr:Pyridoxamine 5-phosphate oxidase [Acidimicrobiaceae bacterium]
MEPTQVRNLDGYGGDAIPWAKVQDVLDRGAAEITQAPGTGGPDRHTCWLATARPDGTPHVRPVGVVWVDGVAHFTAGPDTQKARNLERDPRCSLTLATRPFDLTIDGRAARVIDDADLERAAQAFSEAGWTPTVRDGAFYAEFSAPSAGPPPWAVYRVTPEVVYAFGTAEPYGATRFRF